MKINAEKTQLICVSDAVNYNISSYINTDEQTIRSVDSMKILGFIFGKKPNVSSHIDYIIDKFNKSIWTIIHLMRAKIDNNVLLKVYTVMLRPFLEYCAPVFNSMLTCEQIDRLERQQKRVLKIIYGFNLSYNELLEKSNLPPLSVRREEACSSFAEKLVASERFNQLFPKNDYPEDMVELFAMRRALNSK